jgi:hypothetical protein
MANVRKQEQKKGKVARVPFGAAKYKLQLSDEDNKEFKRRGKVARWFNEQDGRIQRALAGGYKFVKPEHATSLGSGAIHQGNTDEGSRVSKIVSKGDPVIRAYLMEISKKYYDEDQAKKEARNEAVDKALNIGEGGTAANQYGEGVTFSH